jgi:hypothetical protein
MHRFIELIEAMQKHWVQECDDPLTDLGRARVKRQAFDNFKKINKLTSIQIQDVYFKESDLKYWNSIRENAQKKRFNIFRLIIHV